MPTITIKEYFAAVGSQFTNEQAAIIGPVLEELGVEGNATAAQVVEAARSTNSPLHDFFEWDDSVAALKYREHQADGMIRSVRIRYLDDKGEKNGKAFRIYSVRAKNTDARTRLIASGSLDQTDALRELDAWRVRYWPKIGSFGEAAPVYRLIIDCIERLKRGDYDLAERAAPPPEQSDGTEKAERAAEAVFDQAMTDLHAELSTDPEYDELWRQFRPFIDQQGVKGAEALLREFGSPNLSCVVADKRGGQFMRRMREIIVATNEQRA